MHIHGTNRIHGPHGINAPHISTARPAPNEVPVLDPPTESISRRPPKPPWRPRAVPFATIW